MPRRGVPGLIAEAYTNDEVGAIEKLGMRGRVELTRYVVRRGLVEPRRTRVVGADARGRGERAGRLRACGSAALRRSLLLARGGERARRRGGRGRGAVPPRPRRRRGGRPGSPSGRRRR